MVDPKDYQYEIVTDYKSYREYTTLQWTTEPPTQEGWYWAIDVLFEHIEPVYVELNIPKREFFVNQMNNKNDMRLSDFTHWLGPLPVPEPPQGE